MTDIISSISTAISLAKRLTDISKNISNAEFKNLLANLSIELADAKLRIADLISENIELKNKLIEAQSAKGKNCPKCSNRTFELVSSQPHPTFGDLGALERQYQCSSCGFSEAKMVKP